MRIYNEIVFDVDGNVVYEDSYEYTGDVMLCDYWEEAPKSKESYDVNDDGFINVSDIQQAINQGKGDLISSIQEIIASGSYENWYQGYLDRDVRGEKARAQELLLQQTGALTANPLPSLPSISNVGAVPFSGSINWNAVPGGFQPLPQVVGGKKKLYQLSQFHGGINQRSSPRDISDQECQEATNITFSQIGRIRLLGTITGTDNGLSTATLASSATHIPSSGYGLFIFKSAYSLAATPVQGNYTIVASTDGEHVVVNDGTTSKTDADTWLTIANEAIDVAPTFYAAGNGLYACDANLIHTVTRKAAILVYRKDINGTVTVTGWSPGEALLTSPTVHATNTNSVELKTSHSDAGANGRLEVSIVDSGDGNWGATGGIVYSFYLSYLFDNGCETGLSFMGTDTFANEQCVFNVSIKHSNSIPLGGDKRIHGARIYFRKAGAVERFMLAEVSLPDGVKGSLDSTFTPWDESATDIYDLASPITFNSPPELYTYSDLNIYYANEVYDKSSDDVNVAPAPHEVRYRTATVGANGSVFIGCFSFRGKVVADGMMYSMPNKPGVFPEYNVIDPSSSDGTPITVLQSFQDKILQFKENALYIVNISNPTQFYTEASFRDCGIMNPCQAFHTSFGIIFANIHGCFVYDGRKVISLTSGKLTSANWGISEGSIVDTVATITGTHTGGDSNTVLIDGSASFTSVLLGLTVRNITDGSYGTVVSVDSSTQLTVDALRGGSDNSWDDAANDAYSIGKDAVFVPCVGYDPRSQSIIVLKDIGDDSVNTGGWVYNMETQSWTEGLLLANLNTYRHSNFVISPNGYLTICQSDVEALKNYDIAGTSTSTTQAITYWTKDLDFGLPTQTKYLYKVYITYKGDASGLTVAYGVDGETDTATLYHFSKTAWDGTTHTQPLLDKNSPEMLESWHVATLYPDTASEGKDWKSISIYMNGSVDETFEINDISIMYRVRPIK